MTKFRSDQAILYSEFKDQRQNSVDQDKVVHHGPAGPCSAVSSVSDSRARGPGFDTRSSHILSFLLPLIQEGQLSVTG